MNKDPDQDWLDALAGKLDADADPEVRRRGILLREAIKRHDTALGANDYDVEAGLQKLKFRMRREGLANESMHEPSLDQWGDDQLLAVMRRPIDDESDGIPKFLLRSGNSSGERKPIHSHSRFVRYAMAASIVLTVGLTMRLYMQEQSVHMETDVMRGSKQQIVLDSDPEARLKQLTNELDKLHIQYQIERKEGKIILMAQGIDPLKDEVADFLERNHITPPVSDDLNLDIRALSVQ